MALNPSAFQKFLQLNPIPPLTTFREDGLQVAFKQRTGVLEVPFGVGFGGGDAVKRFVEDADDPLLFGERRDVDKFVVNEVTIERWHTNATREAFQVKLLQKVENKPRIVSME